MPDSGFFWGSGTVGCLGFALFDYSSLPKILELENSSDTIVVSRLEHFGDELCILDMLDF
jgi:hypothetical protein